MSDVGAFKRLQHDVVAWNAGQLVPLLASVKGDGEEAERARQRLVAWDRRVTADSADARLYVRWEARLKRDLATRRVPAELADAFVERTGGSLIAALVAPSRAWFDGNPGRARDAVLVAALAAVAAGDDKSPTMTFAHPLGVSETSRQRFNVGPFAPSGYAETVLAIAGTGSARPIGPSLRVIMDIGDWDRSAATNAPGQSGAPDSPHFRDVARLWADGEYFPLAFSEAAVQANMESVLTLTPR
jgi:penicillin amidase